jgi:hypothetical protein
MIGRTAELAADLASDIHRDVAVFTIVVPHVFCKGEIIDACRQREFEI